MQNQRRVVVVNAALVAFAITRRSKLAHRLCQRRAIQQQLRQTLIVPSIRAIARRQHHVQRQIFAAIQLGRFGQRGHIPIGLQIRQFGVVHRLEILRAHQVQKQLAIARQQREFQILVADTEAMPPQLDDVAAALVQIGAILQRTKRLITQRLHARVDVVRLHRIEQLVAQPRAQLLELGDQRITRKEGMQRIAGSQLIRALGQALDDAQRRIMHALRAALAFVLQRLALRFERLQQLLALGDDVVQKLFVFAKLALDFFQLHQQARKLFIALLGRLRQAQRIDDALREQRQLRCKLRHLLRTAQAAAALLGACAHLVQARVDGRDAVHHLRALRGVVDLQAAHQFREHVQRRRDARHLRQRLAQLHHGGRRLRLLVELL
ncbi:hypothetical protein SDC9_56849 [bioreactor metagenome]|uniref:Uncharacterized protein n=1 Tax=bioreactor metagenome TaxID=1076179 RepID=A0A644X3H7_9ZZZZ